MNLQAMMDTDDLDKVIRLLEQNNWDEGQAFSTYMAQQAANAPARNGAGGFNEEMKDDGGVRAPIQ